MILLSQTVIYYSDNSINSNMKSSKLALKALALEVEVLESIESKVIIGGNGDKHSSGNLRAVFDKFDGLIYF